MKYLHVWVNKIYVGTCSEKMAVSIHKHMRTFNLPVDMSNASYHQCNLDESNLNKALQQCRDHYRNGRQKNAIMNAVNDDNKVVTVKSNMGLLYIDE